MAEKKNNPKKNMTGAEILVQTLNDLHVDIIFGYPGGKVIGLYDVLFQNPQIRHILVRHEQGATHAADGYARVTGKPGVVFVTSGPGATNTVTGIATAFMDSIPIVVFTGQVASGMIGNDAFQEADIIGITRPITKHSYLVKDPGQLCQIIHEAFHVAVTGRPGPVLIDLPSDMLATRTEFIPCNDVKIRGYNPTYKGHSHQISKAAELLNGSRQPLIYAGGGVNIGMAAEELTEIANKGQIPVTTTLLGLGTFPEDNPLSLGMVGMHGTWYANMAMMECDVLICIGARFDDRVTGRLNHFSPKSKKIQIDIDPSCISKNVPVDIPIVGHVKEILPDLVKKIKPADTHHWLETIASWKAEHSLAYPRNDKVILPQFVIAKTAELTHHQAIVATDVGQNQMWAAQYYGFRRPRQILSSGGLGTMGYGLPAAMGAAFGYPGKTIVCFTGDGGFQMNIQELTTAVQHKLPLKIILLNNGYLGMVRQWQELFYGRRYASTVLSTSNPDFMKLAEGYGAAGLRAVHPDEVETVIRQGLEIKERPVVMEFVIRAEENVFPIVPPGASLDEMLVGGN
jgi:acetolactate synthase-1/2/3 large subunit